MPLYVKDREVGELADRLAVIKKVSKTAAVREALKNEIERSQTAREQTMREKVAEIQQRLAAMAGSNGLPITKEWRDSLYEDD